MRAPVVFYFLFNFDESPFGILQLRLEEPICSLRQHLAVFEILIDEERREPLADLHRPARVVRHVTHPEPIAFDDLNVDVVRPHSLDDVLHDASAAEVLIQVKVLNDALQPRAAENLLADRLKPILDPGRHRRSHVTLGHALWHQHNEGLGFVPIWQRSRVSNRGKPSDEHRHGDEPLATPRNPQ